MRQAAGAGLDVLASAREEAKGIVAERADGIVTFADSLTGEPVLTGSQLQAACLAAGLQ